MIFFCEHGQLGNQLFQYAALRTRFPDERLILFGFDSLSSHFRGLRCTQLLRHYGLRYRLLKRILPTVQWTVSAIRPIGLFGDDPSGDRPEVVDRRGWIRGMTYCQSSYFQSFDYFQDSALEGVSLQPKYVSEAEGTLKRVLAENEIPIFLHVRRGDYLRWPSRDAPAVLPACWYRNCIEEVVSVHPHARFLVCSDDVPYAEDIFAEDRRVSVCSQSLGHDLALMTLCRGGILSASSFAWWAAYFAIRGGASGPFLAPHLWGGHRLGRWHPPHIRCDFLSYRPVSSTGNDRIERSDREPTSA